MDINQLDEAFTGQPITGDDVVAALIVLAAGLGISFLVGRLLRRRFGRPGQQSEQNAKLVGTVAQWSIFGLSLAWALEILGLKIGGLSFFILVALFLVALAIKPIAESFAISVVLASRPAFNVGDEIGVGGVVGDVLEITERSVVVRLRDGARVHIPNGEVISEKVTVYSTDVERRSTVEVRLVHDTDIDVADQVIREALADVDEVLRIGSIRAVSINGCVQLSIRFWHESSISAAIRASDAVIRAVHPALQQAGIHGVPFFEIALVDSVLPEGTPSALPYATPADDHH